MIRYRLITRGDIAGLFSDMARKAGQYYLSALKSEGYRLQKEMKRYVRSKGEGTWPKFRKITSALRERKGYREIANVIRYRVLKRGRGELFLWLGVIPVPKNAQPPSRQMIAYAYSFVRGRRFRITRKTQQAMAERIRRKYEFASPRTLKMYLKRIPKIGEAYQPPRPFVEPIEERERDNVIKNIRMLVLYRLLTGEKLRR